ncbi:hypothetical protein GQ44DRAFT_764307 [Phaeosphaeriaceae sp. PMI808]|nr:hypothetical protein GQ44DRAFT_764307 [Phaeosphaeriaceae sp. PMI808]
MMQERAFHSTHSYACYTCGKFLLGLKPRNFTLIIDTDCSHGTIYRTFLVASTISVVFANVCSASFDYTTNKIKPRSTNDISAFLHTIFLPWTSPFSRSSKYVPSICGGISGQRFNFPIDTSSRGILIRAPLLPKTKLTEQNKAGWEFLSNSETIFSGRFVNFNITLYGEVKGDEAIIKVPVLVVTKAVKFPGYDVLKDNGVCPKTKIDAKWRQDLSAVVNMGVGFGRNGLGTGSLCGTTAHNPFINVVRLTKYQRLYMMPGYKISTRRVHLGSLGREEDGAVWMDLRKLADPDPRAWASPLVSFTYDDSNIVVQAEVLIDTSITEMHIQSTSANR